jgi:hypothetical protein
VVGVGVGVGVGEELLEPQAAMKRAEESGRAARRGRREIEGSILETILHLRGVEVTVTGKVVLIIGG